VSVDDRFHAWHATVADFSVFLVEYFVEFVLPWEVFLYQVEEESSDVGGNVVIVRGLNQMMFRLRFLAFGFVPSVCTETVARILTSGAQQCSTGLLGGRFLLLMTGSTGSLELIPESV